MLGLELKLARISSYDLEMNFAGSLHQLQS